jgi:hypothetical protein
MYATSDPTYQAEAIDTYASRLQQRLKSEVQQVLQGSGASDKTGKDVEEVVAEGDPTTTPADFRKLAKQQAIEALRKDVDFKETLERKGIPWGIVLQKLKTTLP